MTNTTASRGTFTQIPFWRLRARFRECGMFDEEVADACGIKNVTFGRRMRGVAPWLSSEITSVCQTVGIPQEKIGEYFFPEVEKGESA